MFSGDVFEWYKLLLYEGSGKISNLKCESNENKIESKVNWEEDFIHKLVHKTGPAYCCANFIKHRCSIKIEEYTDAIC